MPRILVIALVAIAAPAAAQVPKTHSVRLHGQTFTLPVGFTIELVAGPPLIERPIHADFDERGFLYVATSSGSNDPVQKQLADKPHCVVRLQDSTGTGKFDKATVFADRMMLPQGACWHAGSLFVAAPPSIWKLTDTDGDGVADRREEWFKGKTLTGCANDLHGPYLGPDGWLYWTKGAFAEQTYERPGRKPLVTKAAHIFRAKPDGSKLEAVMTGGMDNPVEVAFTAGGERIVSATFVQHPAGGRRDGLIHAVYGGVYGKENTCLDGHIRTGPDLMPVMTRLGAAAPAGLMRYGSSQFGDDYRDNLFCAQFNMRKVSRHVLVPDGATFKTLDSDFLVSDSFDFHPTDVLEDADGSLIVLDTGGWYKLCCPTAQLHKPEVLGAIYRIRKTGAHNVDDPRGLKLDWKKLAPLDLAALLGDDRPAVRKRATVVLATHEDKALPGLLAVLGKGSRDAKINAVWTAHHINSYYSRHLIVTSLKDEDEIVRQAALHSVAIRLDNDSISEVITALKGPSWHNSRAAAEALGRIGPVRDAKPGSYSTTTGELLSMLRIKAEYPVAEHSLLFALMEHNDPEALRSRLEKRLIFFPSVTRAMLIGLDQMPGEHLKSRDVTKHLSSEDLVLKKTAWWIATRHPEWGEDIANVVREWLKETPIANAADLEARLVKLASSKAIQAVLAEDGALPEARQLALRIMAKARLNTTPEAWLTFALRSLAQHEHAKSEALEALRSMRLSREQSDRLSANLRKLADETTDRADSFALLATIPGGLRSMGDAQFDSLLLGLAAEAGSRERRLAVSVLGAAKLTAAQLTELAARLPKAAPLEVDRLLEAFAGAEEPAAKAVLQALEALPAKTSLRLDRLPAIFAKHTALNERVAKLAAAINVDAEQQKKQLDEMMPKIAGGDVRRGQAVFNSAKAACAACHAVGYQGGTIGPDLTAIGKIRTERDLLESILFPSASLVRSYEPVRVALKSGAVHSGNIQSQTDARIVLQLAADRQMIIDREEIEDLKPSQVSIMPVGLDQQLSPQDLADLVAFLKSLK